MSLLLAACAALTIDPGRVWAQAYTITDLGDFGGLYTYADAVNDSGQVVGMGYLPDGDGYTVSRAFLWEDGVLKNLGTLGGESSEAFDISNAGVVVGGSNDPAGYYHAFRYASGVMSSLGIQSDYSRANGINEAGQIAGGYYIGTSLHAFLYTGGGMIDLGTFGGTISNATDVNEAGHVVGLAYVASEQSFERERAFLYRDGQMTNLGTLEDDYDSVAEAMNDSGLVVGHALDFYGWVLYSRAVVWREGQISALVQEGSIHSYAFGVNNKGDVVGRIGNTAVLWRDGQIHDLNAMLPEGSGWQLTEARDINEAGQIVGSGVKDNRTRAFLMSPGKFLSVRDAKGDSLPDVSVHLYRVRSDAPRFTEEFAGVYRTDREGLLQVSLDKVAVGDSVRLALHVDRKPSVKHQALLPTRYDLVLDNAKFDTTGQVMSYDRLDSTSVQTVTLDHTEVVVDLLVSVEWDAEQAYLERLETSFRRMANYLYDVFDGQLRIDTVLIYDDRQHWNAADFKIFASNMQWPAVDTVYGPRLGAGSVKMPRKWFGDSDPTRNGTFTEDPLDLAHTDEYRTKAHEFGHYGMGFLDEYQFWNGASWDQTSRCTSLGRRYGFMDFQYDRTGVFPYDSELSDGNAYADTACRNNAQFRINKMSTYEQFERDFDSTYVVGSTAVYAPILRPGERVGLTRPYLLGPNEDEPGTLTYDVGARVVFPKAPAAPGAATAVVAVTDRTTSALLPKVDVVVFTPSTLHTTVQGETADTGMLRALGVKAGDEITASRGRVTASAGKNELAALGEQWLYGRATYQGEASLSLALRAITGDYPLIISAEAESGSTVYRLHTARPFPSEPAVELRPADGGATRFALAESASGYAASVADALDGSGSFFLEAEDDSAASFFVPTGYLAYDVAGQPAAISIKGPGGASDFLLDSLTAPVERVVTLASPYPVIRAGLGEGAWQAGRTHSLSAFPPVVPGGSSTVIVRYADSDLGGAEGARGLESSLRIHRWDPEGLRWVLVGGAVDTVHNEVSAPLAAYGVYGAFTTSGAEAPTDDEGTVPEQFELGQNYPNPFSATTTIEYALTSPQHVTLEVYNLLGQQVATLVDAEMPAGAHRVRWDAGGGASGVYVYRLRAGDFVAIRKMVLVK